MRKPGSHSIYCLRFYTFVILGLKSRSHCLEPLPTLIVGSKFTVFALFILYLRAIFQVHAPWGRFNGGFFTLSLWGAYICTVRRILWRFLTCVRHSLWRSCPGYVLKVYYWWRNCSWLAFRKQLAGNACLEIYLLVKTPLHRRSMEVRRSGLWASGRIRRPRWCRSVCVRGGGGGARCKKNCVQCAGEWQIFSLLKNILWPHSFLQYT